jgi:hypothetical protein
LEPSIEPHRYVGFHVTFDRNKLMFESSRRAYNERMRADRLELTRARTSARRRTVRVCAACGCRRDVRMLDEDVGFCRDCLGQSRIVGADEPGGEG